MTAKPSVTSFFIAPLRGVKFGSIGLPHSQAEYRSRSHSVAIVFASYLRSADEFAGRTSASLESLPKFAFRILRRMPHSGEAAEVPGRIAWRKPQNGG
jgi:hypothetical protein